MVEPISVRAGDSTGNGRIADHLRFDLAQCAQASRTYRPMLAVRESMANLLRVLSPSFDDFVGTEWMPGRALAAPCNVLTPQFRLPNVGQFIG